MEEQGSTHSRTSAQTLDVLATGYPSLDYIFHVSRSPNIDETAIIYQLPGTYTFGGCGANVAVGLARLQCRTGVAMVVGDDEAGHEYIHYLNEQDVDTTDVQVWPDAATSRSHLFINPDDEYQNFFYPGAAGAWEGELSLKNLPRSRSALLTVGVPHYNRDFVDQVLEAGVPLIWQLKSDVYSYPPEQLDRLARHSTLLIMNRIEASYLAEEAGVAHVRRLIHTEGQQIVITHGAQGSLVIDASGEYEIPVVAPNQVADPTGAGDAYTAGFLAGWLRELPPPLCGRMGATLASFAVETIGCQTNFPDWPTLARRYRAYFDVSLQTSDS